MIDVTDARARTEADLPDRCTITRDEQGATDDVFDEATLSYLARPATDLSTVYDDVCSVSPEGGDRAAGDDSEAGQDIYRDRYKARILTDAVIQIGDVLTVTESVNDPTLIGRELTVVEVLGGTHVVTRRLRLTGRTRGPRT